MPKVYPVIATFNRPEDASRQVERLLPQLQDGEHIVVVVDGHSGDNGYLLRTDPPPDAKQLRVVVLKYNVGVDAARIIGNSFVPANGVVIEVDDHDIVAENFIHEIRQRFREKTTRIVYGDVIVVDPKQTVEKLKEKRDGLARDGGHLGYGYFAYYRWQYDAIGGRPLEYFPANDFALFCRLELLNHDRGNVRIKTPLVKVVSDITGISARYVEEQQTQCERIVALACNGEMRLPFRLPKPKTIKPQPVELIRPDNTRVVVRSGISPEGVERRRPRVLLVTEVYGVGRGGGEMSMLGLLRSVAAQGYDIDVLYAKDASDTPLIDEWIHAYKFVSGSLSDRNVMAGDKLRNAIATLEPDIIVTEVRTGGNIAGICESLKIPMLTLVQFWHNIVKSTREAIGKLLTEDRDSVLNQYGVEQLSKSAALVANSEFTARVILWAFGRKADAVVYPPIDAKRVTATDAPRLTDRRLVVCPSVQAGKGARIFLQLAKRNPDKSFLLLAGDNRHSKESDIVRDAEAIANVEVRTDWVSDMREVYTRTRVLFIGTQTAESFCRAAAEARANGIPLLVSDAGNLSTFIQSTTGVAVRKTAPIDAWQAGLERCWLLKPKASNEFCKDHSRRFTEVIERTRSLSDVAFLRTTAAGMSVGIREFGNVCGCDILEWTSGTAAIDSHRLVIMPGMYRKDLSDALTSKAAFWWCSHFAQMDTSRHELDALLPALKEVESRDDRYMLFTCEADARIWGERYGKRVMWLPNVLTLRDPINVDCDDARSVYVPGPFVTRKNVFTALAAIAYAKGEAHVTKASLLRNESVAPLASALRVPLHVHDCPTTDDVMRVASNCAASIMVSSAETYCLAAAESVLAGTPVLAWAGIAVLDNSPSALLVNDPTNAVEVGKHLVTLLANPRAAWTSQNESFRAVVRLRNRTARETLLRILADGG